jgi:hypothetical protein
MKLTLEMNKKFAPTATDLGVLIPGLAMMTPAVGEKDYWLFRVKVSKDQAVIGFPKFGTVGIGYLKETNWNTNLPYRCPADQILKHIKENKGDKSIPDATCLEAIQMVQKAAEEYKVAQDATEAGKRG